MPGEVSNRTMRASATLNVIAVSRVRAAPTRYSNRHTLSPAMGSFARGPGFATPAGSRCSNT